LAPSCDGGKISLPAKQGWLSRPYAGWNARKVASRPTLIRLKRSGGPLKTRELNSSGRRISESASALDPTQRSVRCKISKVPLPRPARPTRLGGWPDESSPDLAAAGALPRAIVAELSLP